MKMCMFCITISRGGVNMTSTIATTVAPNRTEPKKSTPMIASCCQGSMWALRATRTQARPELWPKSPDTSGLEPRNPAKGGTYDPEERPE